MPIKFTGNHLCNHCGNSFEWNYFETIRTPMSQPLYFVDSKPIDKNYTIEFKSNDNGGYNIAAFCPKCRKENRFEYTP